MLLEDDYEHVDTDGDPYLGPRGIFARAEEGLDAQVLLDPLEEQFDLPSQPIDSGNRLGGQVEVVGHEDVGLAFVGVHVANTAQRLRIGLMRIVASQNDGLVGLHAGGRVDRLAVATTETETPLGPCHEEGSGLIHAEQTGEVHIPTVHHVEGVGFEIHHRQNVRVVQFPIADHDHGRHAGAHVEQCVKFDGGLAFSELGPRKQRQAQIDDSGVQRVQRMTQVYADVFAGIQPARLGDQRLGKIQMDTPVADLVGVGQRIARDATADAHVIQLDPVRPQTPLDVPQALAIGQLSKCHAQELVPARKRFDLVIAPMAIDATTELVNGREFHELRKNRFAGIHRRSPRNFRENPARNPGERSNRLRANCALSYDFSMAYNRIPK